MSSFIEPCQAYDVSLPHSPHLRLHPVQSHSDPDRGLPSHDPLHPLWAVEGRLLSDTLPAAEASLAKSSETMRALVPAFEFARLETSQSVFKNKSATNMSDSKSVANSKLCGSQRKPGERVRRCEDLKGIPTVSL